MNSNPSGRFSILDTGTGFQFWTLVADFRVWALVADFQFSTLETHLDTSGRYPTPMADFPLWTLVAEFQLRGPGAKIKNRKSATGVQNLKSFISVQNQLKIYPFIVPSLGNNC